jgi:transcriptional regulator with XRE-family HTH domain
MSARQQHRKILGENLRTLRIKADLSQEKLAEKAGLSTVFVSRIEREIESPSLDSLVKIAKALNVRVKDLVADI